MSESVQHHAAKNKAGGARLGLYFGLLVIVIIALMVMFSYTNVQSQGDTQLYEKILDQELLAQQISSDIENISNNHITENIASLKTHKAQFEQLLGTIQNDMAKNDLHVQPDLKKALQVLNDAWDSYSVNVSTVLAGESSLTKLKAMLDNIKTAIPKILELSEEIVTSMVKNNADAHDVYVATRQLVLIQSIENDINEASRARKIIDEERLKIYSRIGHDSAIYEQTLHEMSDSGKNDLDTRDKILQVFPYYLRVSESIANILNLEPDLARLNSTINDADQSTPSFIRASESLAGNYIIVPTQNGISPVIWTMLGAGLLILISLMIWQARSTAREDSVDLYEVNPRDLVDFVYESVGDIVQGVVEVKAAASDKSLSPYIQDINSALDPVRKRTEFINRTAAKILAISSGMHKSILNIVDVSDGLAQQLNNTGNLVEDIASSMRRAMNDAASMKIILDDEHNETGIPIATSAEEQSDTGVVQFYERLHYIKEAILNLGRNIPEIGSVAGRIKSEASKINLIALNTAIQVDENDAETIELFAADEIQQHAHRIAGTSRHLTELGEVFDSIISKAAIEIESLVGEIEIASSTETDDEAVYKSDGKDHAILSERIQNIVTVLEHQLDAVGQASTCLGMLQEAVVNLSAGVNDIMAGVEVLERLSMELKGPW